MAGTNAKMNVVATHAPIANTSTRASMVVSDSRGTASGRTSKHRCRQTPCDQQSGGAPDCAEEQALDEELPQDARTAGTDRRPDRDLALARPSPYQQEIRRIDAHDQQNQGDGRLQDDEWLPRISHELVGVGDDAQMGRPSRALTRLSPPLPNTLELRACEVNRDSGLQTPHDS